MARKELQIFSLSFLDLLSGALAAVIILFVIVPKQDAAAEEAQAALEDLNLQADQLEEMVNQLENSVDAAVFDALNEQFEQLSQSLEATQAEVSRLEGERNAAASEVDQLKTQRQELEQRTQQLAAANAEVQEENRELKQKVGAETFGVKAEVAIIFKWDANADVDIHLKNLATGEVCFYNKKNTAFATLLADRTSSTGDGEYEMMYQSKLVPGNYELSIVLFNNRGPQGSVVPASGSILVFPYTDREQKIDLGTIPLNQVKQPVKVRTFSLSTTAGIS